MPQPDLLPLDAQYALRAPLGQLWAWQDYEAVRREGGRVVLVRTLPRLDAVERATLGARLAPLRGRELAGCAPLVDIGTWGGALALVYTPPVGVRLDEARRAGPTALPVALSWIRAVALGVQALHRQGILHRHLCPPLVHIDPPALSCTLTGWGVVPRDGWVRETAPPELLHGFAPEELRGGPVDARADLYSLGMLLLTAVTGRTPPPAADPAEALERARAGLVGGEQDDCLHGVPAPRMLVWAVRRCLAPAPDERFAHVSELVRVLDVTLRAMRQEARDPAPPRPPRLVTLPAPPPEEAPASRPPPPTRPPQARRPYLLLALLAALLLSWVSRLELELSNRATAAEDPRPARRRLGAAITDPALEALLRPTPREDLALFGTDLPAPQAPPGPARPAAPNDATPNDADPPTPEASPAAAAATPADPPAAPPTAAPPSRARRLTGMQRDPWPEAP